MVPLAVAQSEYEAAVTACGLLDRSERGKLELTGSQAAEFLQGQVTNDVQALSPGQGCYAAFLTPKGKMLGDLRILATEGSLLLDTERGSLQALFNMIRHFSIGYDVQLHKRTLERGLVSLIGPAAEGALGDRAAVPGAAEHDHLATHVAGLEARAIRTDLGIDLWCQSTDTETLKAALTQAGATQLSEETAELLRVEHGRPRYGVDLDDTVIPQEAGLNERAVSFTKGCYVGQETVARLHYRGKPNRHLRGLLLGDRAQPGSELFLGDRAVGRLGSVASSPRLGPIALALVRREAPPGSAVQVGPDRIPAEVVELPFAR